MRPSPCTHLPLDTYKEGHTAMQQRVVLAHTEAGAIWGEAELGLRSCIGVASDTPSSQPRLVAQVEVRTMRMRREHALADLGSRSRAPGTGGWKMWRAPCACMHRCTPCKAPCAPGTGGVRRDAGGDRGGAYSPRVDVTLACRAIDLADKVEQVAPPRASALGRRSRAARHRAAEARAVGGDPRRAGGTRVAARLCLERADYARIHRAVVQ